MEYNIDILYSVAEKEMIIEYLCDLITEIDGCEIDFGLLRVYVEYIRSEYGMKNDIFERVTKELNRDANDIYVKLLRKESILDIVISRSGTPRSPGQTTSNSSCGFCIIDDMNIGKKINNYQMDTLLNEGTQGRVYKGHDMNTNKIVAIKVIAQQKKLMLTKISKYDVKKEIAIMKKLVNCKNVVKLYDVIYDIDHNTMYLIMEYIEGETLQYKIDTKQIDANLITEYINGIANGIKYLHKNNIIHRDIKPENIMINNENVPILIDFGISVKDKRVMVDCTVGTPYFMAPELIHDGVVSKKSDIWAFGVICYLLKYGSYPYEAKNYMELVDEINGYRYVNDSDDMIEKILEGSLCHEPSDRFTIDDILDTSVNLSEVRRRRKSSGFSSLDSSKNDRLNNIINDIEFVGEDLGSEIEIEKKERTANYYCSRFVNKLRNKIKTNKTLTMLEIDNSIEFV